MKILDFYLARAVFAGVIVTLLIICAVDWLGDVFYQVGKMESGDKYSDVILLTAIDIPYKLFEFLPSSMLIGTLFSLGQFSVSSELTAATASGCSRFRIGSISSIAGLLITICLVVFVEAYAPYGEKLLLSVNQDKNNNILLTSDESYWVRDRNRFIRVGQAISQDLLNDVEIYQFNDEGEIEQISQAVSAIKQQNKWYLQNYRSSSFDDSGVAMNNQESYIVRAAIFDNLLQTVTSDPYKMTVKRLYQYISYLDDNHLDSREYRVALFKRAAVPFVGLAMMLLALPLVFRPRQIGGAGQRLLIGIVIALVAYIIIEALTNGALVYQFSPIMVAFLPVMIILVCSVFAFRFAR